MKHFVLLAAAAMFGLGAHAQNWTGDAAGDGDFFLYNVGTGRFLSAGDRAAQWGTNACLTEQPTLDFGVGQNTDGTTYFLNSRHSNGGASQYLTDALWVDGSLSGSTWTFTATGDADNSYTLAVGQQFLVGNNEGTDVSMSADGTGNNAKWLLLSKQTLTAALAAATEEKPMDATFFIHGSTFNRNDQDCSHRDNCTVENPGPFWTCERSGGNYTIAGPNNQRGTYGCELWNNTFNFYQVLTDLPAGIYELTVEGYGTNGTTFLYAGSAEAAFVNTTGAGSFADALDAIADGQYTGNTTGKFLHLGGNLTIGLKRAENKSADWTVFDNFRLTYYGPVTDLTSYQEALAAAVAAAASTQGTVPTAVYNAIDAVVTKYNKSYNNADDYTTAINAINEAVEQNATSEMVAAYAFYKNLRDAVVALPEQQVYTGSATLSTAESDAAAEKATTTADLGVAAVALRQAATTFVTSVKVDAGKYFDMTNIWIVNPTVSQNTEGWTAEGTPNGSFSWGVCAYGECEFYQQNFDFFQEVTLPKGTFEFGVTGFHCAGNHSTYFYAGDDKVLIPGVESSVVNTMAAAQTYFDQGNGKVSLKFGLEDADNTIKIGIVNTDTQTDKWTIFRNFTIYYYGSDVDYSVYAQQWAEALAAANAALADETNANVTGKELTDLKAARDDAPAGTSKADYLEKINALTDATAAFKAAAPSYDAYIAYKAETVNIWGSALGVTAPKNATEAVEATHNLNIAQYDKVAKEYPYSLTSKIGDLGTWVCTATVAGEPAEANYLNNEHWSGGARAYYEQAATGWGNANGWTVKYEKKCVLPAGDYVIKVAARSSEGTTSLVSCTASDITFGLPNLGAYTRGISVDGKASWSDSDTFARGGDNNEGFGWQWRFLPFTLTEETEVTMTFEAEATTQYQWVSIADGELLSKKDFAESFEFYANKNNNVTDSELANVTIHRDIQAKGYYTVVLPFDAQAAQVADAFGTAVTVYTFDNDAKNEETGKVTVNFKRDYTGTIKANTPVIVYADKSSSEQVFKGVEIVAENPVREGSFFNFEGSYDVNEIFAGDYYLKGGLQDQEGTKVDAFSALFRNITGEVIEDFEVNLGDGTTGIRQLDGRSVSSSAVFNLAGQRVGKAVKGLYIVGGKKVVVK